MLITQLLYKDRQLSLSGKNEIENNLNVSLVLGFGKKELIADGEMNKLLKGRFPSAEVVICSTAGEIVDGKIYDDSVAITALYLEKTAVKTAFHNIEHYSNSFELGKSLIRQFATQGLNYILILSDGLLINGTQLVSGMEEGNEAKALITGGLAGDGIDFQNTLVGLNGLPQEGSVVAIGFYGPNLEVRSSSISGWDVFGPERTVTKSNGTSVYEIDHQSAIDLYKLYLGPYIDDKTNTTLLFPLAVKLPGKEHYFARSILSINYEKGCMVFAGDIPEGAAVRFMKASFEKLIDAAEQAARSIHLDNRAYIPELALLVSCVGRKRILDKQIGEEVEVVADYFTNITATVGFYSYGEISPQIVSGPCELHNQTMTITTFREN